MQTPNLFFLCNFVNGLIRLLRWKEMLLLGNTLLTAKGSSLFQLFFELLCKWQKGARVGDVRIVMKSFSASAFICKGFKLLSPFFMCTFEWIEKFITLRLQNATRVRTCDALEFSGNGNGINVMLLCQCLAREGFQWLLIIHSCASGREDMRSV